MNLYDIACILSSRHNKVALILSILRITIVDKIEPKIKTSPIILFSSFRKESQVLFFYFKRFERNVFTLDEIISFHLRRPLRIVGFDSLIVGLDRSFDYFKNLKISRSSKK